MLSTAHLQQLQRSRSDTPSTRAHVLASLRLSMASLAAAAPKPIKALFAEAEALLRKVEDGHDADDATTCVSLLDDAWAAAAALDLFPAGCTGDDVATADLRYALIPDLRARARSRERWTRARRRAGDRRVWFASAPRPRGRARGVER